MAASRVSEFWRAELGKFCTTDLCRAMLDRMCDLMDVLEDQWERRVDDRALDEESGM